MEFYTPEELKVIFKEREKEIKSHLLENVENGKYDVKKLKITNKKSWQSSDINSGCYLNKNSKGFYEILLFDVAFSKPKKDATHFTIDEKIEVSITNYQEFEHRDYRLYKNKDYINRVKYNTHEIRDTTIKNSYTINSNSSKMGLGYYFSSNYLGYNNSIFNTSSWSDLFNVVLPDFKEIGKINKTSRSSFGFSSIYKILWHDKQEYYNTIEYLIKTKKTKLMVALFKDLVDDNFQGSRNARILDARIKILHLPFKKHTRDFLKVFDNLDDVRFKTLLSIILYLQEAKFDLNFNFNMVNAILELECLRNTKIKNYYSKTKATKNYFSMLNKTNQVFNHEVAKESLSVEKLEINLMSFNSSLRLLSEMGKLDNPTLSSFLKSQIKMIEEGENNLNYSIIEDYWDMRKKILDYYEETDTYKIMVKTFPFITKNYNIKHNLVLRHFNDIKFESDKKELENISETFSEKLKDIKNEKYQIYVPSSQRDLTEEGTQLSHCISSYGDRIIQGNSLIIFARDIEDISKSRYTLEFKKRCDGEYYFNFVEGLHDEFDRQGHNRSGNQFTKQLVEDILKELNKELKSEVA